MSTGSLGQGLSPGVGMALAAKLRGQGYRTWVMLGDGEIQEGQIWEACFTAARYELDNLTAILDSNNLPQFGWPSPEGFTRDRPIDDPRAKFEAFGWHVVECDGHDHAEIERAFAEAVAHTGRPTCVIAHTVKGKGVSFMENQFTWHATAAECRATGRCAGRARIGGVEMSAVTELRPLADAPSVAVRDAWGKTLVALAEQYPELVVLDGDLANSTRADIFAAAVPDRFFEMGIAEQNMLGVAAGMATCGFVPWISTFAAFLTSRALDQIRVVVAQPHLNVKLCGSYSGLLTSKTGKTHQSVDDLAVFRAMPGVSVIAPADANELAAAMRAMMETDGPQYLRLTRDASPVIFPEDHLFRLGKAELLRDGGDVGLISTGIQTIRVLEAAELLAARGIEAAVLHVPTLKPLDVEAIVAAGGADKRRSSRPRTTRSSADSAARWPNASASTAQPGCGASASGTPSASRPRTTLCSKSTD